MPRFQNVPNNPAIPSNNHSSLIVSSSSAFTEPAASSTRMRDAVSSPTTKRVTIGLKRTLKMCSKTFSFEPNAVPRRFLVSPSVPLALDCCDNRQNDLIVAVGDLLGPSKLKVVDLLGKGTFGQVFKCFDRRKNESVAVKVVKNKPAYRKQAFIEIKMLKNLSNDRFVVLRDHFEHKNHVCIVLELLGCDLYQLLKSRGYVGISWTRIRNIAKQLLNALVLLKRSGIIHCDLKPENILLSDQLKAENGEVKIIDFGSACFEHATVFTYVQSRFYRSPEVILGIPYNCSIDVWSLGCILAELFLGLPLFSGQNEYEQLCMVSKIIGEPSQDVLCSSSRVKRFYRRNGAGRWVIKSKSRFCREFQITPWDSVPLFKGETLKEIILSAKYEDNLSHCEMHRETQFRNHFLDLLKRMLTVSPHLRVSPEEALCHPFLTGENINSSFIERSPNMSKPISFKMLSSSFDVSESSCDDNSLGAQSLLGYRSYRSNFVGESPFPSQPASYGDLFASSLYQSKSTSEYDSSSWTFKRSSSLRFNQTSALTESLKRESVNKQPIGHDDPVFSKNSGFSRSFEDSSIFSTSILKRHDGVGSLHSRRMSDLKEVGSIEEGKP